MVFVFWMYECMVFMLRKYINGGVFQTTDSGFFSSNSGVSPFMLLVGFVLLNVVFVLYYLSFYVRVLITFWPLYYLTFYVRVLITFWPLYYLSFYATLWVEWYYLKTIIWPWGQRWRSHEVHYCMRHTALWSCTYISNIIDLSGKTRKLWSGQASLRSRISGRSGRKNQTKTICLPSLEGET